MYLYEPSFEALILRVSSSSPSPCPRAAGGGAGAPQAGGHFPPAPVSDALL